MRQGRTGAAGDDALKGHALGSTQPRAVLQFCRHCRLRNSRLQVRQKLMEEVHSQMGGLLHQPEFVLILNQAQMGNQGFGQRPEESAMPGAKALR